MQITPFTITDESDTIRDLMTATGGKAIVSQRQAVEQLGWSDDVDATMKELQADTMLDAMGASM